MLQVGVESRDYWGGGEGSLPEVTWKQKTDGEGTFQAGKPTSAKALRQPCSLCGWSGVRPKISGNRVRGDVVRGDVVRGCQA